MDHSFEFRVGHVTMNDGWLEVIEVEQIEQSSNKIKKMGNEKIKKT